MPYTAKKHPGCPKSKPYGVMKAGSGKVYGCHASMREASAQIGAIESNEKKEMEAPEPTTQPEQEPTLSIEVEIPAEGAPVISGNTITLRTDTHSDQVEKDHGMAEYYPLYGVTSFAELDELQQSEDKQYQINRLTEQFNMMAGNIMRDEEVTDKAAALTKLVGELTARLEKPVEKQQTGILAAVRKFFKPNDSRQDEPLTTDNSDVTQTDVAPVPEISKSQFVIWKEATGQYRWLAVYSNQFRDNDNPPEIISEKSHQTFIDLVDSGAVAYPELWHWHIPGTRWGQADWLAYSDGFALASGTVDAGHEKEAESLSQMEDVRVSHGMPSSLIVRNKADSSIIDFHVTTEISPLPGWAAANKLTDFVLLKEFDMALPDNKKQYLRSAGLNDEQIQELESNLAKNAKAAKDAGVEFKEAEQPAPTESTPVEQPVEPAPQYTTATEVAAAIADVMAPLMQTLTDIRDRLGTVEAEVKELRVEDAEKVAKAAAGTPRASLQALIAQSILGNKDAQIDGRSALAKAGPKETEAQQQAITPVPLIDGLIRRAQGVTQ